MMYNIAKEVIAQSVRTQSLGQSPSYIINIYYMFKKDKPRQDLFIMFVACWYQVNTIIAMIDEVST